VAGFIGSNLAAELLQRGYRVVGIDNLTQGEVLNLKPLKENPEFVFYRTDIRDEKSILEQSAGCQVLVHLAAYKIPRYTDALETLLINSLGSENVMKAAAHHHVKVVAASTSDVYGKNPEVPFHEDSSLVVGNPHVKRWAYAISKMFEEQLMFAYMEKFRIPVVPLRFFGGYGPNQNLSWWGGPQSVFINQALDNAEIEVHGNGEQTRSFTYISDHVDGIIRAVELDTANNQVFNIGNTREISIHDLALLIWRLIRGESSTPKIRLVPYETFGKYEDVVRRIPDISRARSLLGFHPRVDLEDGLRKTIIWQIQRREELGVPTLFTPSWLAS